MVDKQSVDYHPMYIPMIGENFQIYGVQIIRLLLQAKVSLRFLSSPLERGKLLTPPPMQHCLKNLLSAPVQRGQRKLWLAGIFSVKKMDPDQTML